MALAGSERIVMRMDSPRSPRMRMVWQVLEGPKDAGDDAVIAPCHRRIVADRRGWRERGDPADLRLVRDFAAEE